jgi:hypothetical protein
MQGSGNWAIAGVSVMSAGAACTPSLALLGVGCQ